MKPSNKSPPSLQFQLLQPLCLLVSSTSDSVALPMEVPLMELLTAPDVRTAGEKSRNAFHPRQATGVASQSTDGFGWISQGTTSESK